MRTMQKVLDMYSQGLIDKATAAERLRVLADAGLISEDMVTLGMSALDEIEAGKGPLNLPDLLVEVERLRAENTLLKSEMEAVHLIAATVMTDDDALAYAGIWDEWRAGAYYVQGNIVRYGDVLYRMEQDHVEAQAHQPPGGDGMLAVYRLIRGK